MTATSFTPGPWHYKRASNASRNILDIEGDGQLLGFTAATCVQSPANARLIAAAPDLYAVVVEWLTVGNDLKARKAVREKARAALAKARGEQSA